MPWKPKDVLPPAGMRPLWVTLRAVSAPLLPERVVFQELVTLWPPGSVKPSAQPLIGLLPVLATVTLATKPLLHEFAA